MISDHSSAFKLRSEYKNFEMTGQKFNFSKNGEIAPIPLQLFNMNKYNNSTSGDLDILNETIASDSFGETFGVDDLKLKTAI